MKVKETELPGVVIIEPRIFGDDRGFFLETFNEQRYAEALRSGRDDTSEPPRFAQLNHSHSVRGTLRGLHFQEPKAQGKLVWVVAGKVFDVAVDIRRSSPGFGRWAGCELSQENHRQLWVPPGFAHGFCVLSEEADVIYACTELYDPECERVIRWNAQDIAIEWPLSEPLLSSRDSAAPRLAEAAVLPS